MTQADHLHSTVRPAREHVAVIGPSEDSTSSSYLPVTWTVRSSTRGRFRPSRTPGSVTGRRREARSDRTVRSLVPVTAMTWRAFVAGVRRQIRACPPVDGGHRQIDQLGDLRPRQPITAIELREQPARSLRTQPGHLTRRTSSMDQLIIRELMHVPGEQARQLHQPLGIL